MTARLLHFVVQPIIVLDDGTNLTAAPPVQPSNLSLDALRDLLDNWPQHLADIETQLAPPPPVPHAAIKPCGEVHPEHDTYHPEGHPAD